MLSHLHSRTAATLFLVDHGYTHQRIMDLGIILAVSHLLNDNGGLFGNHCIMTGALDTC